jgi:hypothetical protein
MLTAFEAGVKKGEFDELLREIGMRRGNKATQ